MKEIDIIELDFLARISKAMEAQRMSATALARKAKVSHSGVFRVLSGAVGLSFARAYQLADALERIGNASGNVGGISIKFGGNQKTSIGSLL